MKKTLIAGMLVMIGGLPPSCAAADVGDRGTITIEVVNPYPDRALSNVAVSITAIPSWLEILLSSELGPVPMPAAQSAALTLQYVVTAASPLGTSAFAYSVSFAGSSEGEQPFNCVLTSRDAFANASTDCSHEGGSDHFIQTPQVDRSAPITTLEVAGEQFFEPVTSMTYIAQSTRISFVSDDEATEGELASSVADIHYSIDGGPNLAFLDEFVLSEGSHSVTYFASDTAGNVETSRTAYFQVDGTPPDLNFSVTGPHEIDSAGNHSVAGGTQFEIEAVDPISGGVASGVSSSIYIVDGDTPTISTGPFSLSSGYHLLAFYATDNAGNPSSLQLEKVFVGVDIDSQPPTSVLTVESGVNISSSVLQLASTALISIVAEDAPGPSSSRVANTFVYVDQSPTGCGALPPFTLSTQAAGSCQNPYYFQPFSLRPGTHQLTFFSRDAAGNVEGIRTYTLFVLEASGVGDNFPPRSVLATGEPSFSSAALVYVSSGAEIGFTVVDDQTEIGDALGTVSAIYYGLNGGAFEPFTSPITLSTEGAHYLAFYAQDVAGNAETVHISTVVVDATAPTVQLVVNGSQFAIEAEDPVVGGAASGIAQIEYLIDTHPETCGDVAIDTAAPRGTCANSVYEGPFALSVGTHTVFFLAVDNLGNGDHVLHSSFVVVGTQVETLLAVVPSTGPIGIPLSSDTTYFTITVPSVASLTPSSAPIGVPFTLTGTSFGVYGGANTRVKFNGVVAPLSVWNDTTITGTVPGVLAPGEVELVVERAAGAGLSSSATQAFLVLSPTVSTITPGYGPAGTVVTLTGSGFGPYGGTLTKVLVGGATVPVSVWNDTTIRWTVPSSLSDGEYPVIVRRSPAGGTADSEPVNFTVGTGYGISSLGFTQTMSLAATPDSHFEGDLALSSTTGGRIDTPAKAAVEIPPNAMEEDTSITVKRARSDGHRNSAAEDIKKRAAGEPIEFGPEGTRFATPVTIELPYDPALIVDETKIAIHYFNPLRRKWEELASVVDRARKVVTAKTDHFSIYQPMGLAPAVASQDEFYFRDAYAFPNPSRGGALVTFRIQPGLAETIELRVYDLSGRRIHESTDFTFRGAFDDGNGKGAQNTYDHTWGVSGVGSGVYTFVMKASQRGNKPIVKSGKVGVIK